VKVDSKRLGLTVPAIAVLVFSLLTFHGPFGMINVVMAAGTPDIHNNQIVNMTVKQWNGSNWNVKGFITSANYSANFQVQVEAKGAGSVGELLFYTWVKLNSTLASSGADAADKVMINMSISGGGATGWTNKTMFEGGSGILVGDFYYIDTDLVADANHWDEAGHPAAGQTYTLKIYYWAYY